MGGVLGRSWWAFLGDLGLHFGRAISEDGHEAMKHRFWKTAKHIVKEMVSERCQEFLVLDFGAVGASRRQRRRDVSWLGRFGVELRIGFSIRTAAAAAASSSSISSSSRASIRRSMSRSSCSSRASSSSSSGRQSTSSCRWP